MSRRQFWIGCAVLSLFALSCSSSSSEPGGDAASPSSTTVEAPSPPPSDLRCTAAVEHGPDRSGPTPLERYGCWYDTGFADRSPSVQVTGTDVLFVARADRGILRSEDDGQTWQDIRVPALANGDTHRGGVHGYVYVDPRTDRVWYVTSLSAASCGDGVGSVLSWSDDLGETWEGTTVACDTYDWGKVVTGPAPEGNEYPSAVYFFGVGIRPVGGQRFVYRSLDGGDTWERMENIASATTEAGVGASAPDGTVYFDYPEFTGFDPSRLENTTYPYVAANECRQMVAVSEDHGETWRQEPVPGSQACGHLYGQQRVAVDADGTVYVVWVDDQNGQLHLSTSQDRARTWSDPINVTAPDMTFALGHANIVAGEAGHILIASLSTTATDQPANSAELYEAFRAGEDVAALSGGYTAHAVLTESFDADQTVPRFTSVDVDHTGDPTLDDGEASNEANAYLGMSPEGAGWAVFSRHSGLFGAGELMVARLLPD